MKFVGLAASLLLLAACALPGKATATPSPSPTPPSSHACADMIGELAVKGEVPGLWACLSPSLQAKLIGIGVTGSNWKIDAFATSVTYVATASDAGKTVVIYEIKLLPKIAEKRGYPIDTLLVWEDDASLVDNIGYGAGLF